MNEQMNRPTRRGINRIGVQWQKGQKVLEEVGVGPREGRSRERRQALRWGSYSVRMAGGRPMPSVRSALCLHKKKLWFLPFTEPIY